jgi:hypothetical protein
MKYHLFTVAVLLVALALYAAGMHAGGSLLFLVGAAFELWFWIRVIRGRRDTGSDVPSVKP